MRRKALCAFLAVVFCLGMMVTTAMAAEETIPIIGEAAPSESAPADSDSSQAPDASEPDATEPAASESPSPDPSESVSPEPSESESVEPSASASSEPSDSESSEPTESTSPEPSETASPEPSLIPVTINVTGEGDVFQAVNDTLESITPGEEALSCDPDSFLTLVVSGLSGSVPTDFTVNGEPMGPVRFTPEGTVYDLYLSSLDPSFTIDVTFSEIDSLSVSLEGDGELGVWNPEWISGRDHLVRVDNGAVLPMSASEMEWYAFPNEGSDLESVILNDQELALTPELLSYVFTTDANAAGALAVTFAEAEPTEVMIEIEGEGSLQYMESGEWHDLPADQEDIAVPLYSSLEMNAVGAEGWTLTAIDINEEAVEPDAYTAQGVNFSYLVGSLPCSVHVVFEQVETIDVTIDGASLLVVRPANEADYEGAEVEDGASIAVSDVDLAWASTSGLPGLVEELAAVTLNGEALEITEDFGEYTFTTPAQTGGALVATFYSIETDIGLSTAAPDGVSLETTEDGSMLLTGLTVSTDKDAPRVDELLGWLTIPEGAEVMVTTGEGEDTTLDTVVGTGMQVDIAVEGSTKIVTVVVSGDVLGTGVINIAQLSRMAQALTGADPLTGVYLMAGDMNGSEVIDISDLVAEANMLIAAS